MTDDTNLTSGDPTDEDPTDRLESALERIAAHAAAPDPVATEIATRLDGLIAQLRDALDQ